MKVDVIELLRYSIQWIQIKNLVDTEIGNSRQTADDLEQKLGNVLTLDFSLSLSWIKMTTYILFCIALFVTVNAYRDP